MPAFRADRTLSAWEVDSGRIFLASLRDAAAVAETYINDSADLVDPPEQMTEQAPLLRELEKDRVSGKQHKEDACMKTGPSLMKTNRTRQAPSLVNDNCDANTVEVVKHNGKYQVIIDGVSQRTIEKEDGVYKQAYTFWMPRFKERTIQVGSGDDVGYKRVVQPVVFGFRVEDFESVPSRCVVESMQRVINDGQVYMDDTKIKTSEVAPYQVNSGSANVAILPYPLICTPAPYVTINDYSKALDREIALKLHFAEAGVEESLVAAYRVLTGKAEGSIGSSLRELYAATAKIFKFARNTAAAAAAGSAIPVVGTVAGAGAYLLWEYVKKLRGTNLRLTDGELESSRAMLAAALNRGPTTHRVTLPQLTQMIYRIAETRANGSVVANTDNTLGWSIHDFEKLKWNAEAALLQWIMYGSGERPERNEYTGLYEETANASHVGLYSLPEQARNAPATLNTIGVQGMHPLTLANSRTEFSYVIRIQESDGTPGPVIVLDSTRINGLDAGWIAAGYEEQFAECRRSVDCLRSRLARLPSVSRYMATHGSFVSDSNAGAIVSDDLDDQARLLLGREVDDGGGVALSRRELKRRLGKLKASLGRAENKQRRKSNYIGKLRNAVRSLKDRLSIEQDRRVPTPQQVARAEERIRREQNRPNPDPQRVQAAQEQLDELNRRTNKEQIAAIKQRLQKREADLHTAVQQQNSYDEEVAYLKARKERTSEIIARKKKKFANIFDYEASYKRILEDILGDEPFEYSFNGRNLEDDGVEDTGLEDGDDLDLDEDKEEYDDELKKGRFWTNKLYKTDENKLDQSVLEHLENTAKLLALSLGVRVEDVEFLSHRHIRFVELLSPASSTSDPSLMRFSAFLVPKPIRPYSLLTSKVTRLMPQILVFSRELVSTFGVLTILQPTAISDKTFIIEQDASIACRSISQARVALRNMTSVFPQLIKEMIIYGSASAHFYQSYTMTASSEWEVSKALPLELKEEALGADFFATSYFPSIDAIMNLTEAMAAGGSLLEDMKRVASGKHVQGISRILDSFGLARSVESYLALASFAELLTYHIVAHGYSDRNNSGFQLERIELVQSALSTAKYSSRAIGTFLSDTYGSKTGASRPLNKNDVAFYCIPGLSHLRVAMKRLGLFSDKEGAIPKTACVRVGKSLFKLGSASKLNLQALPFTCVQSAIGNIPISVRMLNGNASSVELHISSSTLSYERVYMIASTCLDAAHRPAVACVCTDVVFTRPISLKAYAESPVVSSAVSASVSNLQAQKSWKLPSGQRWSTQMLKVRLARLRLDIFAEQKHAPAANKASVGDKNDLVELLLVEQMVRLDVRDLSTRLEENTVANYLVPFGFVDRGTIGDMFHSEFEQQPVWIELLLEAAVTLLAVDLAVVANAYVVSSKTNALEQPHNPHLIRITNACTRVQLYPTMSAATVLPNSAASALGDSVSSMSKLCIKLNESGLGHRVSGKLCEHYRVSMHNAERLFQATLALGARVHTPDRSDPVRIGLVVDNIQEFHMPVFMASACIANAMTSALVGSASRVVMEDTGRGERRACEAIASMCRAMHLKGIKAVPFCELCAALSLL